MIVDIGGGTTGGSGILSLGGWPIPLRPRSRRRIRCKSIIRLPAPSSRCLDRCEATAEELKKQIGSASGFGNRTAMRIKGRDLAGGSNPWRLRQMKSVKH